MRNRKFNRLPNFDYRSENCYFVTTCTKNRVNFFGEIVQKEMQCNDIGHVGEQQWHWLLNQYPYVNGHAFVVMPNHVHMVLEICHSNPTVRTGLDLSVHNDLHSDLSLQMDKIKSLSELVGAYKMTTSKRIHQMGYDEFAWQRSFHDHIIRSEKSYKYIVDYVCTNPQRWHEDKFYEE